MRDIFLKRQGAAFWQVTFGDLLTLMLCFFLALLSLGPLGDGEKINKVKGVKLSMQEPGRVSLNRVRGGLPGIVLARRFNDATALAPPRLLRERGYWLSFSERAYAGHQFELGAQAKHRLAKALRVKGYEIQGATVETCCGPPSVGEAPCWELSARRGVSLHGDLVSLGFKATDIRLRVLGRHCHALQGRERKASAARVGFEIKRVRNG